MEAIRRRAANGRRPGSGIGGRRAIRPIRRAPAVLEVDSRRSVLARPLVAPAPGSRTSSTGAGTSSLVVPTGPFRCLAMMISATPGSFDLLVVVLVAVDEHDDVGVLLDGAGFAQVGHHRALVGPRLHASVQLRQRDHRAVAVPWPAPSGRARSRRSRWRGSRCRRPSRSSAAGSRSRSGPGWPHWRAWRRARARSSGPVSAGVSSMNTDDFDSRSTASVSRPHSSLSRRPVRRCCWSMRPCEPTIRSASCEAPISIENTTTGRPSLTDTFSAMFSAKAVLPIDGPCRQDDQVARLQARGVAVEVVEAGAHAGDVLGAVLGELGDAVDQLHREHVHALEALLVAVAFLADLEDLAFGLVEDLRDGAALRIERVGGDLVAGGDQLAQDRALAHDLGVAAHVGRARHALRERVEVLPGRPNPRPCRPSAGARRR